MLQCEDRGSFDLKTIEAHRAAAREVICSYMSHVELCDFRSHMKVRNLPSVYKLISTWISDVFVSILADFRKHVYERKYAKCQNAHFCMNF